VRSAGGGRAGGGAVLPPFAVLAAEQHPVPVAIRAREPDTCADTQARGIGGHQEDAVPGIFCARQQALECCEAQNLGELQPSRPWWEVEVQDLPPQRLGREAFAPRSRLMAGTPRAAPFDQEVVEVRTHLLWTEAIRGALGALGPTGHSGDRGLVGLRGQPLQRHVAEHLGTSPWHSRSCACQGAQTSAPQRAL
jgi:hypothetical protein